MVRQQSGIESLICECSGDRQVLTCDFWRHAQNSFTFSTGMDIVTSCLSQLLSNICLLSGFRVKTDNDGYVMHDGWRSWHDEETD